MEDSKLQDPKSINLMLLGEKDVKTSLKKQYLKQTISSDSLTTVGYEILIQYLKIKNIAIKLKIWDTAGQNRFKSLAKLYLQQSKIVLLVYDIAINYSFEEFNYWIEYLGKNNRNENIIIGIIAHKCDLFDEQVISTEEGKKYAYTHNCLFFETYACNDKSIEYAFQKLVEEYLELEEKKKRIKRR